MYAEDGGRELSLDRLGVGRLHWHDRPNPPADAHRGRALTNTTIVSVPRDAMNIVVQQDPRVARQIGEAIEIRRKAASEALAEAAQDVRVASRLGQRKRRVGRVSIASMVVIEIRYQWMHDCTADRTRKHRSRDTLIRPRVIAHDQPVLDAP